MLQIAPEQDPHQQAKAVFAKTSSTVGMLNKIRLELSSLANLGDMVTAEDVIKGAGQLVSAGATPQEMASILSDMPQGGEALAQWVQGHLEAMAQREQQAAPIHEAARHALGVAGLQALMGQRQPAGSGPGPSPLGPQTAASSPAAANPLGGALPNA